MDALKNSEDLEKMFIGPVKQNMFAQNCDYYPSV